MPAWVVCATGPPTTPPDYCTALQTDLLYLHAHLDHPHLFMLSVMSSRRWMNGYADHALNCCLRHAACTHAPCHPTATYTCLLPHPHLSALFGSATDHCLLAAFHWDSSRTQTTPTPQFCTACTQHAQHLLPDTFSVWMTLCWMHPTWAKVVTACGQTLFLLLTTTLPLPLLIPPCSCFLNPTCHHPPCHCEWTGPLCDHLPWMEYVYSVPAAFAFCATACVHCTPDLLCIPTRFCHHHRY